MKIAVTPLPFRHYTLACLLTIAGLGLLAPLAFGQKSGAASMKIGIIGAGNIGSAVGAMWIKAGHQVMFSSRHPEGLKPLVDRLGPLARAGTVKQALDFAEVMLLAVPYGAYGQIGRDYAKEFVDKIVLDAGNAVLARDGEIGKEAREVGVGLTTAKYFAGARIVRALNIMGARRLETNSHRLGDAMAIPIAGDDQEAIKVATKLVRDAGFEPVLVGNLERSRLFAQGGPLYGQEITAKEMQERLKTFK